jgi:hypothetical protein
MEQALAKSTGYQPFTGQEVDDLVAAVLSVEGPLCEDDLSRIFGALMEQKRVADVTLSLISMLMDHKVGISVADDGDVLWRRLERQSST